MVESNNPIAQRSQEMIIRSFCELLERKSFTSISMQMIADNAGLGRRTIYRHFVSKEDILSSYLDQLEEEYLKDLSQAHKETKELTASVFFHFFYRHLRFLRILHENGLMMLLLDKLDRTLDVISETLRSENFDGASKEYVSYYRAFYSGCYWRLLSQWLENGAKETPEEMADMFRCIILSAYDHLQEQAGGE